MDDICPLPDRSPSSSHVEVPIFCVDYGHAASQGALSWPEGQRKRKKKTGKSASAEEGMCSGLNTGSEANRWDTAVGVVLRIGCPVHTLLIVFGSDTATSQSLARTCMYYIRLCTEYGTDFQPIDRMTRVSTESIRFISVYCPMALQRMCFWRPLGELFICRLSGLQKRSGHPDP